jgi:L-threonylcarbamoyladenylate synthase
LVTSSANQPGEPPAETLAAAHRYFGEDVDFYLEGGDLSGRQPSTIIRVIDDAIEVLREGAVKISETGKITK